MNKTFKKTAFIWNRNVFVILNIFTVSFDKFNASLVSYAVINNFKRYTTIYCHIITI